MRNRLQGVGLRVLVMAAVIGMAGVGFAGEVVLYSSNQPELIDMVSQGFEKKTGIKVSAVRLGTGEAMKRIQAEKDNPLGDVFWSGDVAVLDNAKKFFLPYRSPEAKGLPAHYVEKDGLWTSTNVHPMIIMVNTKLVPAAERPVAWKDLFLPKWKGKIVMANPEKSGSAYAQVYGLYKLYGWDGLKTLIANAKILDSSSLIYKGTAEGEYALGLTMEYAAYRYIAGGSKEVGIVYPKDGVFDAPEGAAIVANCKHPAEAKRFFDYLLSREVEQEIFQKHYRRPARADIPAVEGLPKLSEITLMKGFDPIEANTLEKEILKQWKEHVLNR
jgi:iron(III) transport system substrate-binding protein